MKVLLHACCGPCASYCVETLREAGHQVYGYFYNPNIHPSQEYQRRLDSFLQFAEAVELPVLSPGDYDYQEWLRRAAWREQVRCPLCYQMRLEQTARIARHGNFDAFTTTLLISPYQKHEVLLQTGEAIAASYEIPFLYMDFRPGFRRSIELSKEMGLYRQQYCGCIYSEAERYAQDKVKKKPTKK